MSADGIIHEQTKIDQSDSKREHDQPAQQSATRPGGNPHASVTDFYEDIPAIAAIFDERGIILSISREASGKFSNNASRMVGRSIYSLAHRDDRQRLADAVQTALADRSQITYCELRIWRGRQPALTLRTSIRAATTGDGPAVLLAVASDVSDEVLLERQLLKRSSELSEMANRLVVAQNEERRRIAADMHDSVGHNLALAKFQIDGLKGLDLDESGEKAVASASQQLQEAIDTVRSLTFTLHSTPLHSEGLDAALDELGQSLTIRQNLQFSLSSRPRSRRLSRPARLSVYRIVRELLVNVVKHAQASQVRVSVGEDERFLHILVADNGVGIADKTRSSSGTGLQSVRSQLKLFNGEFSIESSANDGTRISVRLPYHSIEAKRES
ncbi:MAG: PAS domain-containing sensor histidine kinase [Gammaproteobacteria bacterium]|nr:PAS domain-containing sensor histidine kinase [Gammaproteobacteria bacterium]NNF67190.1 PAS domain-containing sensor histidine kinase [Gammaproteobacteria bacterium]